jgi:hypothetical protein
MKSITFRVFAGLVLLAAIVGIGFFAYNAGVAHGTVVNLPASGTTNTQPYPYFGHPWPFWGPLPFFGFGCFGPLLALFLVFLAFGAFRRLLWGPRWGWHHMYRHHWMGEEGEEGLPPFFGEWHRRAHGESAADNKE